LARLFTETLPCLINKLLNESWARRATKLVTASWADKEEYVSSIFLDPILHALYTKGSKRLSPVQGAAAKCAVNNGLWTNERLFASGLAAAPHCIFCGQLDSLQHRLYLCLSNQASRVPLLSSELSRVGSACHPKDKFFTRGIMPRPIVPSATPEATVPHTNCPPGGKLVGTLFITDGSCEHPTSPALARVGWACFTRYIDNSLNQVVYGPVPCSLPQHSKMENTKPRCVCAILYRSGGCIAIDCASVVSCISAGPQASIRVDKMTAGMYRHLLVAFDKALFPGSQTQSPHHT
jgi:hypothetical protein